MIKIGRERKIILGEEEELLRSKHSRTPST